MKAILCKQFGTAQDLTLEDIQSFALGSKELLINVKACALNFPDVLLVAGKYQFKPNLPFSPGSDISGVVKAIGNEVTKFKIGDEVFGASGWGGFAEECKILETKCFKKPKSLSFEKTAALTVAYTTALHALKDRAKLQKGETLLILGASGGCGMAAIELGKMMGAKVIAAASTNKKLKLCQEKGADRLLNYTEINLKETVKKYTQNKGVDVIFDPVGGNFSEQALRTMAWNGRHLIIGFTNGEIPKIPLNLPLLKSCQIVGVFLAAFIKAQPDLYLENMNLLIKLLEEKKINPHIQSIKGLENVPQAIQDMADRKVKGKIVIQIGE